MATVINIGTGNFTTAGTWGLVDSTSYLDSEAGSTAISTSNLDSSTFTPGAITVLGIAVKLAARASSPSGTFTMTLRNSTDSTDVASVTVNVSAIDSNGLGWLFGKFSASQLLTAGKAYLIRVVCSASGSQVTLYRNATSNNWSRLLVTTTTQAPASGDQFMVAGFYDGASNPAPLNNTTVTMNDTSGTSYGPTVSGGPPQGVTISNGGTLTSGTTASTNYTLKWKGVMAIYGGATLNMGTSGTPMPSTSTLLLTMDVAGDGDTGIEANSGATWNAYGATKTPITVMTADKASSSTVIALGSTTGWAANDNLCFASTTRTNSQSETKAVNSVDSSTQVTLSAGLTNAHSGTSPTAAEVGNLTRNVQIYGTSTSLRGYVLIKGTATSTRQYIEHKFIGAGSTSNKHGIEIQGTGTVVETGNTTWMPTANGGYGWYCNSSTVNNFTITDCIAYAVQSEACYVSSTTGTNWTITGCLFMLNASNNLVELQDYGGTFTNNVAVSANTHGLTFNGDNAGTTGAIGTFSGNTFHANGGSGIQFTNTVTITQLGLTLTNTTCYRNVTDGITLQVTYLQDLTISTYTAFGNGTAGIRLTNPTFAQIIATMYGSNWTLSGDTTFATSYGIRVENLASLVSLVLNTASFGVATGIKVAHATADISPQTLCYINIIGNAVKLSSSTPVDTFTASTVAWGSALRFTDYQQTTGNHKSWQMFGTITQDSSIFATAAPSQRLTPNTASYKLESGPKRVTIANAASATFTAKVRKSVVGDGTAYNGNQPRLILRRNAAVGLTSDTVLATSSAAGDGAFETLSGTSAAATDNGVMEVYVDCDGTTGWVNVDDWVVA